jgi:pimeloyl-ACP methyl ester carboxylesterase
MSPLAPTRPRLDYGFGGAAGGPALVLVNGLGGVRESWYHQVLGFKRTHRVLTFNQRGVGGSEVVDADTTCHDLARDLVGLCNHLGLFRAVFVGASFGGRVALELALGWPGRVVGLVLVGCSGGAPDDAPGDPQAHTLLRRSATLSAEEWLEGVIPRLYGPEYRERHAARLARLARWWARNPQPAAGIARQWQAWERFDRWADLPALRLPCLVVHGEVDELNPPANGRRLAACIPSAGLALLPGVGHSPHMEDPAAFNAVLRAFLARIGHLQGPEDQQPGGRRHPR